MEMVRNLPRFSAAVDLEEPVVLLRSPCDRSEGSKRSAAHLRLDVRTAGVRLISDELGADPAIEVSVRREAFSVN
jgi:hypothetical protein